MLGDARRVLVCVVDPASFCSWLVTCVEILTPTADCTILSASTVSFFAWMTNRSRAMGTCAPVDLRVDKRLEVLHQCLQIHRELVRFQRASFVVVSAAMASLAARNMSVTPAVYRL